MERLDEGPISPVKKPLRCIIIGAGVSGILMAYKLREAFGDTVDFQIFEKNPDIGGTWFENRYPGCACDVPSHIYQFSFCPNPYWSKFYASSAEIHAYLKAVVLHFHLDSYIHLNSKVQEAIWQEDRSCWSVTVEGRGRLEADILVNSGGILNNPKYPDLKHLNRFEEKLAHTAAWDPSINLKGKRVAIIGAGASAIQVLPEVQEQASHVDIYIRTPSWITPPAGSKFNSRFNHVYTQEEKLQFRDDPEYSLRTRKEMESSFNSMFKAFFKDSEEQRKWKAQLETRMRELIPNTELQEKLIPAFEVGCRRVNPGERYLATLQADNVQPIFTNIKEVTTHGILDESGEERLVDVIIAATGFDTSFRPRFPIIGENGVDLRDLWKTDPVSYCGLALAGFPNYLMFLGPNTPIANGSLIGVLEATADYFVRLLRKKMTQRVCSFAIRHSVQSDFDSHTRNVMERMVWTGSCRSWFKNSDGRITAVWPGSGLHYREFLESDRWEDWDWRYASNQFDYWESGVSSVETQPEENRDLSQYIQHHSNLPLKTLQMASNGEMFYTGIDDEEVNADKIERDLPARREARPSDENLWHGFAQGIVRRILFYGSKLSRSLALLMAKST